MNIYGFMPVRIGSKAIPKKNIKVWNNKPLLLWACESFVKSDRLTSFYVATDSEEINIILRNDGIEQKNIYKREHKNAQDVSSSESVLLEFLEKKSNSIKDEDVIVFCQATSPYITPTHLDAAIKQFLTTEVDSLLSVTPFNRFIWSQNGQSLNYDFTKRPRRQEMEPFYLENGAIYISKVKSIKKTKNRISGKIGFYFMKEWESFEIDEQADWLISEKIFQINHPEKVKNKKHPKLFVSDVDGTLTDGGMYYNHKGEELKKYNTRDGMGFEVLRKNKISTGIITSENTKINEVRAKKLNIDYLIQGKKNSGKLGALKKICFKLNIKLSEVAYIGDDINCFEILNSVGYKACPSDATPKIQSIAGIEVMKKKGGAGCVREFIEKLLDE